MLKLTSKVDLANIKGFMVRRPRIGITMRLELETGRFYLGRDYSEAVEEAGGVPVHIALIPKSEYVSDVLAGLDGILLPGCNSDVDPHYYGEEPHHALGTVIPVKDETERLALAEAERLKIPILAICYGMQALNVWRGGTLIQDIPSQLKGSHKHEQGVPAHRNSHGLKVAPGSVLNGLNAVRTADGGIRVNSSHHQAINNLGKGLKATAWALDGVVECVEDRRQGRFIVGVQWHPELTRGHDGISRELFCLFVEKCMQDS
ncbi:MAG: gamma-glutamyl-gamma-aminobutyrate hydrolase family protein [Chloracidobacterium sp.]|nr:gamma-glutamyl-gamma-aminobutyrate hydrolase family protein [Chloracidobacterium sp.]